MTDHTSDRRPNIEIPDMPVPEALIRAQRYLDRARHEAESDATMRIAVLEAIQFSVSEAQDALRAGEQDVAQVVLADLSSRLSPLITASKQLINGPAAEKPAPKPLRNEA